MKGTNFLEISAGTAIPSVVAALCGAHVVCTDYEPEAIEMAKENALLNATTVEARVLDWHRLDACPRGAFDVVVGSEVLFDTARSEGVGRALAHALKKGGTALIADPGRPFTGKLLEVLTKGGLTAAQYQKCYFSVHISRSDTTVQPTIFIYATKGPPAKPEIRAILERKCEEWGEPPEDFIPKIDHAKVPKPPPLPPAR